MAPLPMTPAYTAEVARAATVWAEQTASRAGPGIVFSGCRDVQNLLLLDISLFFFCFVLLL
jgi:hypothetical protein